MHFGPVRINADLNGLHAEIAQSRRLRFANQYGIRLELDAERKRARTLENFKKILPQKDLPTAAGKNKNARFRHLLQQMLDLHRGHLTVIVVIEIAVHALLVATVGKVELRAEGDS